MEVVLSMIIVGVVNKEQATEIQYIAKIAVVSSRFQNLQEA